MKTPNEVDESVVADGTDLPPVVDRFARRYDDEIGVRDRSLWTWVHEIWPRFRLSSVATEDTRGLRVQKTLLTMYITLLDDLADTHRDRPTFEAGATLPFHSVDTAARASGGRETYLALIRDIWSAFESALTANPRYDEYHTLFYYDLRDCLQAMRYSFVLDRTPTVANRREAFAIGSYNMVLFPYAILDLMHAPAFDRSELGALRSLVYDCQELARIGNWLSSWRREVEMGDLSSGVVIEAIASGHVDPDRLATGCPDAIEDAIAAIEDANLEAAFIAKWVRRRDAIAETHDLDSVDVTDYLAGMEAIFADHLDQREQA